MFGGFPPIMGNHMQKGYYPYNGESLEKKMETEMETGEI